jgi:hypothetical protein
MHRPNLVQPQNVTIRADCPFSFAPFSTTPAGISMPSSSDNSCIRTCRSTRRCNRSSHSDLNQILQSNADWFRVSVISQSWMGWRTGRARSRRNHSRGFILEASRAFTNSLQNLIRHHGPPVWDGACEEMPGNFSRIRFEKSGSLSAALARALMLDNCFNSGNGKLVAIVPRS